MRHRHMRFATLLLISLSVTPAFAQIVVQAVNVQLQPHIKRDEVGFSSCGVRAVVLVEGDKSSMDAYDFSIVADVNLMHGLLKAGKFTMKEADLLRGGRAPKPVLPAPIKFWITKESEGKAVMPTKVMPAETKGYILEISDFAMSYEVILAMIHGERMQFAVRYKAQPYDVVVSYAAAMSEEERKPVMTCLDGLVQRLSE